MSETHTFTLVFTIPEGDMLEPFLDALADAGCDDAAFIGPAQDGTYRAEFDREADLFSNAIVSAIEDIRTAIPGATVLRAEPDDLVTISAIAARTGRSDESVRLLEQGKRGPGGFPARIGHINQKTRVWRWADVADWFACQLGEPPPRYEHAAFLAALNAALVIGNLLETRQARPDELDAVARLLPERESLKLTA
jgi:hypothetical protein